MDISKHLDALRTPWSQESLGPRLIALGAFAEAGPAALPALVALIGDTTEPLIARVWGCMAVQKIGRDPDGIAVPALLLALKDSEPGIRRAALDALGAVGDVSLAPQVEPYLADSSVDAQAWFDDDCTVGHAAERALAAWRRIDDGNAGSAQ